MITLIEPPGGKRGVSPTSRSHNHLLGISGDDDIDQNDLDVSDDYSDDSKSFIKKIDGLLVGTSNSGDFSEQWRREFSERPSWCDADMTLQQIKRGKAVGNRPSLYSRSFIQKVLYMLGSSVQRRALIVVFTVVLLFAVCCYGLQFVRIETDIVKLWVAKGGRLDEELNFLSKVEGNNTFNDDSGRESGLDGRFQVVIQVPEEDGQNVLNQHNLLEHVRVMEEIASFQVAVSGVNWTLSDICFKPPTPDIDPLSIANNYASIISHIIPCIWITPIDCFWEGAKAIGPHPPVKQSSLGLASLLFSSLDDVDIVSWSNINPTALVKDIEMLGAFGNINSFFNRADIGKGYLDRWCIDPLDPDCPKAAPNHFNFCGLMQRFLSYAKKNGIHITEEKHDSQPDEDTMDFDFLFDSRKKRSIITSSKLSANETSHTYNGDTAKLHTSGYPEIRNQDLKNNGQTTSRTVAPRVEAEFSEEASCMRYRKSFAEWMKDNPEKWHEFLNQTEFPSIPDFGKVMNGGCRGFAKGVMSWPQDLIVGGAKKVNGHLISAEALQSVILVSSPHDVYLRFKDSSKGNVKEGLNLTEWNLSEAEKVIISWQRKFTQMLYDHEMNEMVDSKTGRKHRRIHPLASTSIADMLEEFCQFNYTIILVGYLLMLIYAVQSQMKVHNCKLTSSSCMGLAFAGVLTVTFASISGLGFATWCGIEFNAATTQVVPFLTLGIGVDNMFLLLHNYHSVLDSVRKNEIGVLMKETGMSVVMTSFNNILSFLAGTLLPIPALRSFCAQTSILLTFNLVAILTIYPAIISLDLRRRRSSRRDIFCCCIAEDPVPLEKNYSIVKPHLQHIKIVGDTVASYHNLYPLNYQEDEVESTVKAWRLRAFLRNHYVPFLKNFTVKVVILTACFAMFCGGICGMYKASYGLELSDVLPEHTAPAAFLKARDKYFSFYPMFAVIKGPDTDYPNVQHKIDNYRNQIAKSKYVVKVNGEASEKYWLSLLRTWLKELQATFEQAIEQRKIDEQVFMNMSSDVSSISSNLTERELLALRLICSYGNTFNCNNRVGKIRLVDASNTINVEGFYNYVTAWYNLDSIMYHVSQASFIPPPPRWTDENTTGLIPPCKPFVYSQIPFYLTGLTDTPVILDMIKEIRAVCDDFALKGLSNFPSGIAFTFWEQYIHLRWNLIYAIGVIALSVFCFITIILLNPWAAGIITVILLVMTVELAGFLGLAGIKLNPVSAVTIITAVGIGVEFTAHVVLAFLTSLGSRNDRMALCIDRVFVPVIHGALSTLLGIIMLAFSEFEFVVKYFFVVMSALIVIGAINGLVLLPVLVSLIGPSCEVTPVDGSNRLCPPPPILSRKKRRRAAVESQTHRRNISDDSNTATLGPEISSTVLLLDPARTAPSGGGIRVNSHARSVSAHINSQNYSSSAHYESLNC
uniref:SSD domain-containing protein n=1 Tax=Syphacia muris TaxID=451379 RepID=A0A0N5AWE3_9BILA